MLRMYTGIQSRLMSEEGASLVEYALLVALIAVVAIVAISFVGTEVSTEFQDVGDKLDAVSP